MLKSLGRVLPTEAFLMKEIRVNILYASLFVFAVCVRISLVLAIVFGH